MNTKKPQPDKRTVARKVRRYLKDIHPEGAELEVLERGVRREEFWWYVPVRPSQEPDKRSAYYEALAEVEGQLEEKEKLTVFLAPG